MILKQHLLNDFLTSSEDEKLAENFKKLEPDEFSSQKTELKANKEVSEFRMEFTGVYI